MSTLRTPLYQWHVDHKARMMPFAGWDMPVQYDGISFEHKAVRSAVGVFDISHMARVSLGGPDSLPLLEKIFTNSIGSMRDMQVRYGLVCKEDGAILDDILVYRWPYGFAAVINASNREKIIQWLEKHKGEMSAQIQDQTFDTTMVALQGPKAVELVAGMFADDVTCLKYYYAQPTRYRDKGCVVSRTGYTGEDGFEIMVPNAVGTAIWEEFVEKGAMPCGLGARDTLRLEAAMPLYGHELTAQINPIQAGLAWAVKLDKGEFIGRDALQRAGYDHTKPVRVGLEIEGKRAAREGSDLTGADGQSAGTVTSGSYCPWLDKSLAMAYVRPELSAPGTALNVNSRGTTLHSTVVPLPFYKRKRP